MTDVIVVGAGVSGLSCAVRLLEAGFTVRVWTRDAPATTTSSIAAAIWYPFHAQPRDRVAAWARTSLDELVRLAAVEGTGIRVLPGVELSGRHPESPWWAKGVPGFRRARPEELPPGRTGHAMQLPAMDMPIYLDWLQQRVDALGGEVRGRTVASLDKAADECPIVVNCTGLGARELEGDFEVYAARGQVVHVRCPEVNRFILDNDGPQGVTYVIPRTEVVVLGGTSEDGVETLEPDAATTEAILGRCRAVEPRLKGAEVVAVKVGLRPCRTSVRLEAAPRTSDKLLIHNYGHGGAGVTVSWGCADEVVQLVRSGTGDSPGLGRR